MIIDKSELSGNEIKFLTVILCILLCGYLPAVDAQYVKQINIGVLAFRGMEKATQMWQPTAQYLESQLKGYQFNLKPLSLPQMEQAVANNAFIAEQAADKLRLISAEIAIRNNQVHYPLST